jgi:hypothetical protein
MIRFGRTLLTLAMFVPALAARASDWGPVWDSLAEQPGSTVSDGKDANGAPIRQINLASQVSFLLRRQGDHVEVSGVDNSGHGAVGCAARTFPTLMFILDTCAPGKYPEMHRTLAKGLDDIDDFTAKNSIIPVTKESLQQERRAAEAQVGAKSAAMSADDRAKECHRPDFQSYLSKLEPAGGEHAEAERIRKVIAELLSVPRPPVSNPCI